MANFLKIMDYSGDLYETTVDLDKLDEILHINIDVISGDEIATVIYENGMREVFDSSNDRIQNFYDGSYTLYSKVININRIVEWNKRKSSHDAVNF